MPRYIPVRPFEKTLVVYASRTGCTADTAFSIAKHLRENGVPSDVLSIEEVNHLSGYSAVIIGSPIRYDKWLPEATSFINTHQTTLQNMPVAMFFTCLTLAQNSDKAKKQAQGYAASISTTLPQIKPSQIGQFAGVLDYSTMPRIGRLFARGVFAILRVKEGDYRNWEAIHSWVNSISFNKSAKEPSK